MTGKTLVERVAEHIAFEFEQTSSGLPNDYCREQAQQIIDLCREEFMKESITIPKWLYETMQEKCKIYNEESKSDWSM